MSLTRQTRTGAFARVGQLTAIAAIATLTACASAKPSSEPRPAAGMAADWSKDARVGLKGGLYNAQEAVSNMKVTGSAQTPPAMGGAWNSDITFTGKYAIQGNFGGLVIWDMTNPAKPELVTSYPCPASQNDVSVYRNLMFMSVEANNGRIDCTAKGVQDTVSAERMRGVRIFDITDIKAPKLLANVQTCRGSHTHTVLEDPKESRTSISTCPGRPISARRMSWPDAPVPLPAIQVRHGCASRSSRCRSPIRRRRRWSVAPTFSRA